MRPAAAATEYARSEAVTLRDVLPLLVFCRCWVPLCAALRSSRLSSDMTATGF